MSLLRCLSPSLGIKKRQGLIHKRIVIIVGKEEKLVFFSCIKMKISLRIFAFLLFFYQQQQQQVNACPVPIQQPVAIKILEISSTTPVPPTTTLFPPVGQAECGHSKYSFTPSASGIIGGTVVTQDSYSFFLFL